MRLAKVLFVAMVLLFGTNLFAQGVVKKAEFAGSSNIPNPRVIAQGGDNVNDAFFITSLPFSDMGNTIGYTHDYDGTCQGVGSAPDVVYKYIPITDATINISLCAGSDYDTRLIVFKNSDLTEVACNDDACSSPNYPSPFISKIENLGIAAYDTFFIVIGGYNNSYGNYTLDITVSTPPVPLQDSLLIAYYPFNSNANDESGNGFNGTTYGSIFVSDRFGNGNSACEFNGIDDYVDLPNLQFPTSQNTGSLSIWFNHYSADDSVAIITKSTNSSNNAFALIWLSQIGSIIYNSKVGDYTAGRQSGSGIVSPSTWHHLVIIADGTNTIQFYLDGDLISSSTYAINTNNRFFDLGDTWVLGKYFRQQTSGEMFFSGALDDIRLYSYPLTTSEIQSLFHEGGWQGQPDYVDYDCSVAPNIAIPPWTQIDNGGYNIAYNGILHLIDNSTSAGNYWRIDNLIDSLYTYEIKVKVNAVEGQNVQVAYARPGNSRGKNINLGFDKVIVQSNEDSTILNFITSDAFHTYRIIGSPDSFYLFIDNSLAFATNNTCSECTEHQFM
jgi:hypothetical protein